MFFVPENAPITTSLAFSGGAQNDGEGLEKKLKYFNKITDEPFFF